MPVDVDRLDLAAAGVEHEAFHRADRFGAVGRDDVSTLDVGECVGGHWFFSSSGDRYDAIAAPKAGQVVRFDYSARSP